MALYKILWVGLLITVFFITNCYLLVDTSHKILIPWFNCPWLVDTDIKFFMICDCELYGKYPHHYPSAFRNRSSIGTYINKVEGLLSRVEGYYILEIIQHFHHTITINAWYAVYSAVIRIATLYVQIKQ